MSALTVHYLHIQVVNFVTTSPGRAAFGLVVRSSVDPGDDRLYVYCLAASFAASAAVAAGRCPKPVESVIAAELSGHANTPGAFNTIESTPIHSDHVATLQARVNEAKRSFLHRLCQQVVHVSCLVNSPEELLVDVPAEDLGFSLEPVFNAANTILKTKKFIHRLSRSIYTKVSRRLVPRSRTRVPTANTPHGHTRSRPPTSAGLTHGNASFNRRSVLDDSCGTPNSLSTRHCFDATGTRLGNSPPLSQFKLGELVKPTVTADELSIKSIDSSPYECWPASSSSRTSFDSVPC